MASKHPRLIGAIPAAIDSSDQRLVHELLDGLEHLDLDRRGSFEACPVTLWTHHRGASTGTQARLVGTRPGNVLVVLSDFALNHGERVFVDKRLGLDRPDPRAACDVRSSRPGQRAGDAQHRTYVLELQRARA